MRQKSTMPASPSERLVKTIRRATRKQYSAEEKIRIVLDGLRGESSIAELCCRGGYRRGALLQLVEGVPGSRQVPAGRRHGAIGDEQRGDGPSP